MFQFCLDRIKKRAEEPLQLYGLPARMAESERGWVANDYYEKTNGHQRSSLAVGLFIFTCLQPGGDQTGQHRLAACFYGFSQILFCFSLTWHLDVVAKHPSVAQPS